MPNPIYYRSTHERVREFHLWLIQEHAGYCQAPSISMAEFLPGRRPQIPGMPAKVESGQWNHYARFTERGGTYWISWSCPRELVEADPAFDGAVWEWARASEYWAAKEGDTER